MMRQTHNAGRSLACALALVALMVMLTMPGAAQQSSSGGGAKVQAPKEFPSDRIAGLVAEWTRAKLYTKEYLDAMPEDGIGFKPTPEIRSFAEQMLHLSSGSYFFAKAIFGVDPPVDPRTLEKNEDLKKSKAALTKTVMDSYDFVIDQIKASSAAKMDESVTLFGTKMPRSIALAKVFEHQTHHRGQTTIYLRLKGVTPPAEKLL
jgi:uncharacterized damage-inducible protein DinB